MELIRGHGATLLGVLAASCILGGCGAPSTGDPASTSTAACSSGEPPAPRVEPQDDMTPLRVLRRASITLLGAPPTDEQMKALPAGSTPEAFAAVDAFIDQALQDPRFYETMFETARTWINLPLVAPTADPPEYGNKQQRGLAICPAGTPHEGGYYYWPAPPEQACAAGVLERTIEPWWAPGTQITLVDSAASTAATGTSSEQGNPITIECEGRFEGTCGCGPNAQGCFYDASVGWGPYLYTNPDGQRRMLAEEPARLFAHLVWHDRPATDLVLADYSVGPTELQAAYVIQGIAGGDVSLLTDDRWWRPSRYSDAPTDPQHKAGDPKAWREFTISDRNTFLLADRHYTYDPRTETAPSKGFPSAGALTSPGFLSAYPRERVRAARALETFACEQLLPPDSKAVFNTYVSDPGREGPCQSCHKRIDPAALHFKRWGKHGHSYTDGYGSKYFMPGVGTKWRWGADWRTFYPGEPFTQWITWYRPNSLMTPVTDEQVKANPYALFIDFLPPEETLLGQKSDGTVGPLGFAKMIVAAGAFDRCIVRQVHRRIFGRDIDPSTEGGYFEALTAGFVEGGRKVRPLIRTMTQSAYFRKGG